MQVKKFGRIETMEILIINNHTKNLPALVNFFNTLGNVTVVPREGIDGSVVKGYKLIVLSGGFLVPSVMNHEEVYELEIDIIKQSKVPVIGICLGFEIIIQGFGGELENLSLEQKGVYDIDLDGKKLEIFEHHMKRVSIIPEQFVTLAMRASSKSEEIIEIARHKTRPIMGFQFHPELHNSQYWGEYIEQWYENIYY